MKQPGMLFIVYAVAGILSLSKYHHPPLICSSIAVVREETHGVLLSTNTYQGGIIAYFLDKPERLIVL